jgi:hypothetical protein
MVTRQGLAHVMAGNRKALNNDIASDTVDT